MNPIIEKLPIAVLVAIGIFIAKEVFESIRRLLAVRRKRRAFRFLLAEETEKNYWAFISIYQTIDDIKKCLIEYPNATMTVVKMPNGELEYRKEYNDEYDSFSAWPIVEIRTKIYDRILIDIADVDKGLFKTVNIAYGQLSMLNHVRTGIEKYIMSDEHKSFLPSFPDYANRLKTDIIESLQKLNIECTGKELSKGKIH